MHYAHKKNKYEITNSMFHETTVDFSHLDTLKQDNSEHTGLISVFRTASDWTAAWVASQLRV